MRDVSHGERLSVSQQTINIIHSANFTATLLPVPSEYINLTSFVKSLPQNDFRKCKNPV